MEVTHRRARLLEIIQKNGFSSLPDLVETLEVSESTVRRDLSHLERGGVARRTHGGAFYTGPSPHMTHFRHRQQANWRQEEGDCDRCCRAGGGGGHPDVRRREHPV